MTEQQQTAKPAPPPACFPCAGQIAHAWRTDGRHEPERGQPCQCGKARWGEWEA